MKKIIVGFISGILFGSAISFATFTYKKTILESWSGVLTPGQRIITVDADCRMVRVYPPTSRMTDVKVDKGEVLKITMVIKK